MIKTPDLREAPVSQVPALQLLQRLGWKYLSPEEALKLRGGKLANVLLEDVLIAWLRENNHVKYKDRKLQFTESNIFSALQELKTMPFDGLIRTNEKIYDLLCFGKSLTQIIDGDKKSFALNYIDWLHPENNVFHVTEEFEVARVGSYKTRRPDIVLFVNGIPLGVVECKSPAIKDPIKEAVSQQLRNQKSDQIPNLFVYSQLLMAISKNDAKYATTGSHAKFWSIWREHNENIDDELQGLVNTQLTDDQVDQIHANVLQIRQPKPSYNALQRQITAQDRAIFSLCRPHRLLELIYFFTIYDAGEKKIARYQQYFCVKKIMERIHTRDHEGRRQGGVVWHTQGSGKSLTMVMLAKLIVFSANIPDEKIVLVTDRIDLDKQIRDTFRDCEVEVERANTGRELAELLQGTKQRVITTVINKFEAAIGRHAMQNSSDNIFVLVDEGHRTNYGKFHANMRRVLPKACYIGFTGTPVMKKNKNTIEKFGGLIDAYTIDQAVEDKAVVPLLYEGRHVEQYVDAKGIDAWFDKITKNLSKEQVLNLKKKFSTTDQLNKTEQKVKAIAWDIGEHFSSNWQGEGVKGQLVTPSKATALLYKKYLDEFGQVSSEVLVSPPDEREGEEDIYAENTQPIQRFWKAMMEKYGNKNKYDEQVLNAFKNSEHPEIIIVVDKLLTGFNAPRNTIMYLTRKLKDHTLLQAIARVNRLNDGKDYGYIIDYRGVLENLDHALDLYSKLPEFNYEDLAGVLKDVKTEIDTLAQKHSSLWNIFKTVRNKHDAEEYERLLADEELRAKFYERLSAYAKTMAIAMASVRFYEETSADKVQKYRADLRFFSKLRMVVRRRYAEVIDFGEFEPKIQKLLDTHVGTGVVEKITPLVNIFEKDAFAAEVEKLSSDSAKADTIAHRTMRTIHERMQEDPVFYKRFSEILKQVIKAFHEGRIQENEYLNNSRKTMFSVINRTGDDIPDKLINHDLAKAYFGILKEMFLKNNVETDGLEGLLADAALGIDTVIQKNSIVSWANNPDVQNHMRNEIEDILFDVKGRIVFEVSLEEIDAIIERSINVAKNRHAKSCS
ncbi:MAG: type I restriction endonuclease subunit R [Gammaproteobacteria bacterium]|nr:type I restriction endonuclease subunit R [Gammaproteobacteria bacterium]